MSQYKIEDLRTRDYEIFDTLDECREYIGDDNYMDFTVYELVRGGIETELYQDVLKK